jgi:multicomponent Na+:H+ antiporter subunit D
MPPAAETLGPLLLAIAGATMIFGILGALAETDLRRALAFMLVSSIGFSLLGLGLGSHAALAAGLFYTWHSMLATTALFLLAGTATQLGGARSLSRLAGLYRADPLLAALFLLAGFAAAGLPPFSGFWGKVFLVRASLLLDQPLLAGIALLAGLLTTIAIARIWALAFWRDQASSDTPAEPSTPAVGMVRIRRMAPAAVLVALLIAIGFWPRPLQSLAEASAGQLLDSGSYIARVLGGRP